MIPELIAGAWLLGNYAYHRIFDEKDIKEKQSEFRIPTVGHGEGVPVYFGRVRVRAPVLAATSQEFFMADTGEWNFDQAGGSEFLYGIDMLFSCGIGFENGVNKIHNMWGGDLKMTTTIGPGLEDLVGDGGHENPARLQGPVILDRDDRSAIDYPCGFGLVEFLNGKMTQTPISDVSLLSNTYLGDRLSTNSYAYAVPSFGEAPGTQYKLGGTTPPGQMPGYRGQSMVFLFSGNTVAAAFDGGVTPTADRGAPFARWHQFPVIPPAGSTLPVLPWIVGASPEPPTYSFEMSTYPNWTLDLQKVGLEANPADVLWGIFRDTYGKLGLPYSRLDYETFRAVAEQLRIEGHGFSRVYEGGETPLAGDVVLDVLKQIDGLVYEDQYDLGRIKLRLIRPDFDATTLRIIDPDNARLEPLKAAGRSKLTNKMRVVFESRAKDYEDDSVTADNGANAVGQDGAVRPEVLEFRGIKTATLAGVVASRELAAASTPLARFRAIVDRREWRVLPGDRVVVNWPKWNISGMIMIVGRVSPGSSANNDMALDLIQDFYYSHRFIVSDDTGLPHHPMEAIEE